MTRLYESMSFPFIACARLLRNGGPSIGRITRTSNREDATAATIRLLTISNATNMINNCSTAQDKILTIILPLNSSLM